MDATSPQHPDKIAFANQLRAVAALSVMIVHLFGVYWGAREVVARHIAAPVLAGASAGSFDAISFSYFNFGPFGVSLFFLISGFVIPFSVTKTTRMRFFAARVLRIFPTYLACLGIGLGVVALSSKFWQTLMFWGQRELVANAMLLQSVAAVESLDMVNWSLAVEVKFYLIACLVSPWIRRGKTSALLLISTALTAAIFVQDRYVPSASQQLPLPYLPLHLSFVAHDLMYIPYMFVGTLFYFHFRGQVSARHLLMGSMVLLAVFLFAWKHSVLKDLYPLIPLNYVYALCVFGTAYVLRAYFKPHRLIDWLASVSYPLYCLHTLVGYAAIRFFGALGVGYYPAVGIAVILILVLAFAVHRLIEVPTQQAGRDVMRAGRLGAHEEASPARIA